MKKFLKALLFASILTVSSTQLVGCGMFFSDPNSGSLISKIEAITLENGDTKIVITYEDEYKDPVEFVVPKGKDGVVGNGIKEITSSLSEDGKHTLINIEFTDEDYSDKVFEVKNGVSIKKVESFVDEKTGEYMLKVIFTDDTESEPFEMPRGQDGNGIIGFDPVVNEDGSQKLTFHFSQSEDVVVDIPAPSDGRGIKQIVSSESDTEYFITIIYTDDTEEPLTFAKPVPTTWHNGSGEPEFDKGNVGDYYLDIVHNDIYYKDVTGWSLKIDFDSDEEPHKVTFNLNDSDEAKASMPVGYDDYTYEVKNGTYFSSSSNGGKPIPSPTRNGYKFIGWYTSTVITPTTAQFNELTPVFDDITLYARWEKI